MTLIRCLIVAVVLAAGVGGVDVFGQEPAQVEDFRPVAPGELDQERLPAAPLVYAAYAFVWISFVVYLFVLWQRVRKVESELTDVRAKLGGTRR